MAQPDGLTLKTGAVYIAKLRLKEKPTLCTSWASMVNNRL
jgi:hypothetical protein